MLFGIQRSLFDWSLLSPDQFSFVGLGNYGEIFRDSLFWHSTRVTFVYTVGCVVPSILLGLVLAVLLNGRVYGKAIVRVLILIPMIMAPVAVGLIWKMFFWESYFGLINYFLSFFGIEGPSWLSKPTTANISIIITGIWTWTPFVVLVLEAAISKLPKSVFEAATMDGASRWQLFRHLTVPMIKAPLIFVILFRITTDFRYFDVVYVMTQGGPGISTRFLSLYIYFAAMHKFVLGYANAVGVLMMIMVGAMSVFILWTGFRGRRARAEGLWEE